jgi:F-type H+-transporting ATPase subunit alpha
LVYDDLSKHAVAYRQLSLLLRRPPGREAYPGDVFYLHSRLLERAPSCPIKGRRLADRAADHRDPRRRRVGVHPDQRHLDHRRADLFGADLFYSGQRPAVNAGISVSRVGGSAQIKAMKKFAGSLRLDFARYRELAAFAQFGSDLDKETQQQLARGARMMELLKQDQYEPMPIERQVAVIFAGTQGLLDEVPVDLITAYEPRLLEYLDKMHPEYLREIAEKKVVSDELNGNLTKAIKAFNKEFMAEHA